MPSMTERFGFGPGAETYRRTYIGGVCVDTAVVVEVCMYIVGRAGGLREKYVCMYVSMIPSRKE